jgi:hypothetical protein
MWQPNSQIPSRDRSGRIEASASQTTENTALSDLLVAFYLA